MVIDGRAYSTDILTAVRARTAALSRAPRLGIIVCAPNFETTKYLELKRKKAAEVGIETNVVEMASSSTTDDVLCSVEGLISSVDGVIVQLPLPPHIDTARVLFAVPTSHDADALNPGTSAVLSPVAGAIAYILTHNDVDVRGAHVSILGYGKLVGMPAAVWFRALGATVDVVTRDTPDIAAHTRTADIVVCGAGVPGLLTPDMVKDGVVILDAGTSEEGGVLRGDADPACAEKASLFTPVPGGIGPMTVALLLQNVTELAERGMSQTDPN